MSSRRAVSNEPPLERAALVGVATRASRRHDPDIALEELIGLARAAGAEVVYSAVQERATPDPATVIGRGKAASLALACEAAGATLVIVDHELTPAQTRNLENVLGRRVIDRAALILDIFARRARSREGQLQVELAQLEYLLPRLAGSGTALSRLGGGIGTRGPGETKLETDRRRIRHRIAGLKREIERVGRRRHALRARRHRTDVPTVALVGYTNAGKTTLFNLLTGEGARASDALFVTLDPLVRRIRLPDARQILLSDTVGFIDRLPHQLVAAFRATLEEVVGADLLLHVIDAAAPDRARRIGAVQAVLAEIGAEHVPVVAVYNKIDRLDPAVTDRLSAEHPDAVLVSARLGTGQGALLDVMASRLAMDIERLRLALDPARDADRRLLADLYRHARVVSHTSENGRVWIDAEVPRRFVERFVRASVPA
ncbi:MAG TPA: GTPase HflX [Vicinamibacterales bacterium]|nr:GTPase HflX [Vicinamibacterales bacterium]